MAATDASQQATRIISGVRILDFTRVPARPVTLTWDRDANASGYPTPG
jgi:hypothetical protein